MRNGYKEKKCHSIREKLLGFLDRKDKWLPHLLPSPPPKKFSEMNLSGCRAIWLGFSCLQDKHFSHWAVCPAPDHLCVFLYSICCLLFSRIIVHILNFFCLPFVTFYVLHDYFSILFHLVFSILFMVPCGYFLLCVFHFSFTLLLFGNAFHLSLLLTSCALPNWRVRASSDWKKVNENLSGNDLHHFEWLGVKPVWGSLGKIREKFKSVILVHLPLSFWTKT